MEAEELSNPESEDSIDYVTESSPKQIPKPQPQASPTEPGGTLGQSTTTHTPFVRQPKFIDGASCEEYTDEVCLEQQKDLGLTRRHKCCYKGIYVTDRCIPELCSEENYNVCCFQKFIQVHFTSSHRKALNKAPLSFSLQRGAK